MGIIQTRFYHDTFIQKINNGEQSCSVRHGIIFVWYLCEYIYCAGAWGSCMCWLGQWKLLYTWKWPLIYPHLMNPNFPTLRDYCLGEVGFTNSFLDIQTNLKGISGPVWCWSISLFVSVLGPCSFIFKCVFPFFFFNWNKRKNNIWRMQRIKTFFFYNRNRRTNSVRNRGSFLLNSFFCDE